MNKDEKVGQDNTILFVTVFLGMAAMLLFVGSSDTVGMAAKTTDVVKCIETDDGQNIYLRGTTYLSNDKQNAVKDFCRGYNSDTLVEYYCVEGKIFTQDQKCANGCFMGACKG